MGGARPQAPSPFPPNMAPMSQPFPFSHGMPPGFSGPPIPHTPKTPPAAGGGVGGLLQGLADGAGQMDIQSMIANAQKMIGIVNQVGPIVKNISPMLQMLKGFNAVQTEAKDEDLLTDFADETQVPKKTKKRRKRKRTTRRRKRR